MKARDKIVAVLLLIAFGALTVFAMQKTGAMRDESPQEENVSIIEETDLPTPTPVAGAIRDEDALSATPVDDMPTPEEMTQAYETEEEQRAKERDSAYADAEKASEAVIKDYEKQVTAMDKDSAEISSDIQSAEHAGSAAQATYDAAEKEIEQSIKEDESQVSSENRTYEEAEAELETAIEEEAEVFEEAYKAAEESVGWTGSVLTPASGVNVGPSGKETYYNLDMSGVVQIMRGMGNTDEYWVRDDGCKMLGDYIMCAANLDVHPRGSLVESSLGTCIVCDTGGFAAYNPQQLDIAVTW